MLDFTLDSNANLEFYYKVRLWYSSNLDSAKPLLECSTRRCLATRKFLGIHVFEG